MFTRATTGGSVDTSADDDDLEEILFEARHVEELESGDEEAEPLEEIEETEDIRLLEEQEEEEAEGLEEEEEEAEEEAGPGEEAEAALDEILHFRNDAALAGWEEEDEFEDEEGPRIERVLELRPDEFVCRQCFLIKKRTQLADRARSICRDCVS